MAGPSKSLNSLAALRSRLDGWVSVLSGIGSSRDKSTSFTFCPTDALTPEELETIYHENDLARTIVSAVVKDSLRNHPCAEPPESDDVDTTQDKAAKLAKRLDELKAIPKLKQALIWGRLFGGAALVKVYKGGGLPETPAKEGAELKELIVVDRRDLVAFTWYADPLSDKFGKPEKFRLQRTGPGAGKGQVAASAGVIIHESRLIMCPGSETSDRRRARNSGWDDSVLVAVWEAMRQSGANWASVCAMFLDMSQKVYKLKGFISSLAEQGETVVMDRLAMLDRTASVTRAIVLDAEDEDYEVVERGALTGVGDLVDKSWIRLAAAARMPVTRLLGQSPAGLNATGASDTRNWYDEVQDFRTDVVGPAFLQIVQAIDPGTEWTVSFPSLWQMSPTEEADYRNKVAQTDKLYYDMQAILPEEIALSRFGRGKYSAEYEIDLDARKASLDRELESMETGEPTPEEAAAQELALAQASKPGDPNAETEPSGTPDPAADPAKKAPKP